MNRAVICREYLKAQAEIKRDFLLAPVLATKPRKPKWFHPGSPGCPGVTTEQMSTWPAHSGASHPCSEHALLGVAVFQHQHVVGKLKK